MPPEKLAERLSVSLRTLERWRVNGEGPRFLRVGPRRVIYPVAEIEIWESRRVREPRRRDVRSSEGRVMRRAILAGLVLVATFAALSSADLLQVLIP
jgi:hypothetical protein